MLSLTRAEEGKFLIFFKIQVKEVYQIRNIFAAMCVLKIVHVETTVNKM